MPTERGWVDVEVGLRRRRVRRAVDEDAREGLSSAATQHLDELEVVEEEVLDVTDEGVLGRIVRSSPRNKDLVDVQRVSVTGQGRRLCKNSSTTKYE